MADIQSNININVDTTNATAAIRNLQAQISAFHQQMQKSGSAANVAASANMQRNLQNSINATGKFAANLTTVKTETEAFTGALEKNKLSMGQYFRYAGASSRTFGRMFRSEFNTISKVAESRVRTLQTQYIKMGRDANGAMKAISVRPLSLDMKNLSTQTMIAAQKQQIFNQLLNQGSTNLLNFGKNTQWAGRQLMVGFTVPLSIMGATAIKEFQKIEEQVIKLKRVYGDMFTTDAETEKAVQQVRQLADEFTKYGIAVESTIGLAASVAQMGNVGADMINQVTEATKLAVLGGMEQEKALDTTISLTNAFGIAAEDLTEKINFLNAAENQTILAIDDFTEAVPKAGSVVAQLGGSVEDLAFFLTAMREGGVNASQAANALKSSLARLINPTQQAQDDLKKLGIDIMSIVEGNVGDLRGTIFELGDALDQLQPLERSRALEELFGKFQFARMSTLFQNISKEGSQAQEILRLTRSSAAELQVLADRELSRVEESPATKLQKQIEKLQAALAPIGAEFVKLITPIVEFVTGLLKKFNEMDEGAKSFVTGLVTVLGLIAPAAIMSFGLIANGIANVMKAFNAYRSFLQILSGSNRDITTSTQYMTQEQLESASVAANLGQAHQYLSQQFTVEASALNSLTAAYQAATSEMMRYNTAAMGVPARPVRVAPTITKSPSGRRAGSPAGPVGYNKGTLNVPGPRGAGDIVPAVLSPGEAVIPARQSQKYSGFLEAIMNDDVPGMFFGGIAGMLGRSRVATRMGSGTFMSSLRSGDLSYKSGFATGTGADFTDRLGRPMKQHQLMRRQAEKNLYGVPTGVDDPSQRPTYGSVAMSPLQRILSILFGGRKGRQFAQVTNPLASPLDQYGDISLIGKRSMNRRASTFVGDTLLKYSKNPAWVRGTAPMRGATPEQMKNAGYGTFDNPFGAVRDAMGGVSQNTAPQYIEAQTMGGFKYNEIDKIITKNPVIKKQLRAELKAAGLGNIPVRGPGLVSSLFAKLGVPGFKDGVFSLPGPKGAGDIIPAMLAPGEAVVPAKQTQKYAGLIKGIISDNIPGFQDGRIESRFGQRGSDPAQASHFEDLIPDRLSSTLEEAGDDIDDFAVDIFEIGEAAEDGSRKVTKRKGNIKEVAGQSKDVALGGYTYAGTTTIDRAAQNQAYNKAEIAGAPFTLEQAAAQGDMAQAELDKGGLSPGVEAELKLIRQAGQNAREKLNSTASSAERLSYMHENAVKAQKEANLATRKAKTAAEAEAMARKQLEPVFRQAEAEMREGVAADDALNKAKNKYYNEMLQSGTGEVAVGEKGTGGGLLRDVATGRGRTGFLKRVGKASGERNLTYQGRSTKEVAQKIFQEKLDSGLTEEQALGETFASGAQQPSSSQETTTKSKKKKPRRKKSEAQTVAKQDGASDAKVYSDEFDAKSQDPYMLARDKRNSPHPQAGKDGADDARAYNQKFTQSGAPTPPGQKPSRRASAPAGTPAPTMAVSPGGVPQPGGYTSPIVDPMGTPEGERESKKSAKGFVRKFGNKFKNAGESLGKKALNALEDSSVGRNLAAKLGAAAGNTVVDRDGNVMYDADADVSYDKDGNAVGAGYAASQAAQNRAEAGEISQDVVIGPDGNPVVDKRGRPVSQKQADKQARRMASRQKRGMVAGRLAGAMGSASMVLGMSSMMPGVGDNPVMQAIQGFMPALFGLSAVLPMLAALPGPLGILVGVVGAVAAGLVMWNMELKKTRKEYRELGESLSAGTDSMQAFANAAGTATPTEIMNVRREGIGEQVQYAVGKTPFATQFFDSEDGRSLVKSFEDGASKVGRDVAISSVTNQLATAISSGILSREQAGQIALELGNQIDDFGVSIAIAGELNELFGPNGEKLLNGEPLDIFVNTSERSMKALQGNVEQAIEAITNESSFISEVFQMDEAAIAGFAAGALTGFIQEQEMALNAFEVQSDKRIESLEEEADKLEKNGQDASSIYQKIADERESQEQARLEALDIYQDNISGIATAISSDAELSADTLAALQQQATNTIETAISAEAASAAGSGSNLSKEERIEQEFNRLVNDAQTAALEPILNAFGEGLKAEIDENVPEAMQKITKGVIDKLMGQDDLSIEAKILMSTYVAGGDLDASSIVKLIDEDGEGYFEIIGDVMLEGGPKATAQIDSILKSFSSLSGDEYTSAVSMLFSELNGLENIDLSNTLDQLTFFSTFAQLLGENSLMEFLSLPDDQKEDIQDSIDLMEELKDSTPDEPLTVEQVLEQKVLTDPSMVAAFKADAEFFEDLDPVQQFLYIQRFVAIRSVVTEDEARASLMNRGVAGASSGRGADRFAYSQKQIDDEIARLAAEKTGLTLDVEELLSSLEVDEKETTPGGDGGPVGSMLDSLTSKLKLVRDETVKFTTGWKDSMEQLMNLFGDDRRITIFDGIQQQLRSLGAGENLIQLIAGMDPDEFEERKNELFTIKNGQIVALKDAAISIGDALNAIKIGEFQDQQEATLAQMENQETAFQLLREAGLSVADAYSVIADEALAAAIATGELTDGELEKLKGQIEDVRESSQIAEALENARKEIAKFNEDLRIEADIQTYVDSAGFQTISTSLADSPVTGTVAAAAIFKDETLKGLVAAGKAGSEEFVTRLKQVLGDSTFMQALFDEGYQNVQTAFQVQEERIRSDFEEMLKAGTLADGSFDDAFGLQELADLTGLTQDGIKEIFNSIADPASVVENAQQEIATLNYEIDDLNAELRDIQLQEEEINEKYDDRIEALEKVEKANESIARAQKSQLTIADALSKGDIAAAARAVQQAREEEAKARAQTERDILDEARDAEIKGITSSSGKTREELEEELQDLENKIAKIEEERLEPAQRLLDLSGLLLDKQIEYDEVLGRTRDAWAEIRLGINEAKIASDEFVASMEAALEAKNLVTDTYTPGSGGGGGGGTPSKQNQYETVVDGNSVTTIVTDSEGNLIGAYTTHFGANETDPYDTVEEAIAATERKAGAAGAVNTPGLVDQVNQAAMSGSLTQSEQGSKPPKPTGGSNFTGGAGSGGSEAPPKGVDWNKNTGSPEEKAARERSVAQWAKKEEAAIKSGDAEAAAKAKYFKEKNQRLLDQLKGLMAGGLVSGYAMGGLVQYKAGGGVIPSQRSSAGSVGYFARGGGIGKMFRSVNTDTVPAMLTAGEFVVRKSAVDKYGANMLKSVNNGTYGGSSVYNYSVNVNVKSGANPDEIARTVMSNINRIDAQRMRSNRF